VKHPRLGPWSTGALLVLGALLTAAPPALAEPPQGLSPAETLFWRQAEELEDQGQTEQALRAWRQVLRTTDRPEAALAIARLLLQDGRVAQAEAALREGPPDRDVRVALVRLQLQDDRPAAARRTLQDLTAYTDPEIVWLRAWAQASQDPLAARDGVLDWLEFARNAPLDAADAEQITRVVVLELLDLDEVDAALELIDAVSTTVPEVSEPLEPLRQRVEIARLARQLTRAGERPLSAEGRRRLREARALWEEGQADAAAGVLDALVVQAPASPEVRGLRARLLLALDRPSEAEVELLVAEALDPLDPRWSTALGDLLSQSYAGRYDVDAVAAWDRALALEPRRADVWLRKARVELRLASSGRVAWRERARRSLQRAAELDGSGATGTQARSLLGDLDRKRPDPPALPETDACGELSAEACEALGLARAWFTSDVEGIEYRAERLQSALEQVRRAQELAPGSVRALNLEAAILRKRSTVVGSEAQQVRDRNESLRLYERSLELEPEQPRIWLHLGAVHQGEGDHNAALAAWRRATQLDRPGGEGAHLHLAEHALDQLRFWEARAHVNAYRAAPGEARYDVMAREIERRVVLIERGLASGAAVLGLAVLAVPVVWLWRRRRGSSVQDLLDADPQSWRDVARIASALRHEVLKHHTSVLPAVADALEQGDDSLATWVAERLGAQDGPLVRGRRYLDALRDLGRRAGVPLDLERRDPVFRDLVTGLDRLERIRRPLSRGARRVVPELRTIAELLNERAYPALGALVQQISVLEVNEQELQAAWTSVRGEPAFREASVPDLHLDLPPGGEPLCARIWREDLELVLVNLLRNALEATVEAQIDGRVGVRIRVEEDPITFLQRIVLRVRDDAPRRVSTAMIRGRYIERGLGLTVDVISRNGGSIHVEDEPGWSKAVVVRLPRIETRGPEPTQEAM